MKRITSLVSIFVLSFFAFAMSASAQLDQRPQRVQPFNTSNNASSTATPPPTASAPAGRVPVLPIPQGSYNRGGSSRNVVVNRVVNKRYYMNGVDKEARLANGIQDGKIVTIENTQNAQGELITQHAEIINGHTADITDVKRRLGNLEFLTGWPMYTFLFFLVASLFLLWLGGYIGHRNLNILSRDYRRFEGDFYQNNLGYGNRNGYQPLGNGGNNNNVVALLMPVRGSNYGGQTQLPAVGEGRTNYHQEINLSVWDRDLGTRNDQRQ